MRWAWIGWLLLSAVLLPLVGSAQQQAPGIDPDLATADKLWREKSFGPALTAYEAILVAARVAAAAGRQGEPLHLSRGPARTPVTPKKPDRTLAQPGVRAGAACGDGS
jgi:hypothetical protein